MCHKIHYKGSSKLSQDDDDVLQRIMQHVCVEKSLKLFSFLVLKKNNEKWFMIRKERFLYPLWLNIQWQSINKRTSSIQIFANLLIPKLKAHKTCANQTTHELTNSRVK